MSVTYQVEKRIHDLGREFATYAKAQNLELLGSGSSVFFRINDSHRFCVRPVGIDRFYRSVELADHEAYFLETPGDLDPTAFFEAVLQRCFVALRSNMVPMIRLPDPAPLPTPPPLPGVYEAVPHGGYTRPSAPAEPERALFREEEPERRSRVPDDDGPGLGSVLGGIIESAFSNDSGGSGYDGGGGDSGGGGASGDW